MSVLTRLALRAVPVRWRDEVARDLADEGARRPGAWRAAWTVLHVLRIAARFRARQLASACSLEGVVTGFGGDLRGALRRLRRTPGATFIAVLTLAAAVAGVTAVYSVLAHTVLSPLPFPRADRLVSLWSIDPASPGNWRPVAPGDFVDYRRGTTAFERLEAARNISMTFTGFDDGDTPLMRRVTAGWFDMLGVPMAVGRGFTGAEDRPNGPPVALLSYATWQRRYGGRPDVVGKTVELDGDPYTIVGVVAADYSNPVFGLVEIPSVWLPLQLPDTGADHGIGNHVVIGRLRDGASLAQVAAELAPISESLARDFPATNARVRAFAAPATERLVAPVRTPVMLTFAAVLAVFVAACGNVANVLLARALSRRQEVAVQQALGAPRLRLILQAVAESMLVAVVAGVLAVWLAEAAGRAIVLLVPESYLSVRFAFAMDWPVLLTAAAATVAAGLLCAVPAVIAVARAAEAGAVAAGAIRAVGGRGHRRWSALLVSIEMTVAVVLLAGAGLVAFGFDRLRSADPGFDVAGGLTFRVSTRGEVYADPARRIRFFERVGEAFEGMPGVTAVGATSVLPIFPQFTLTPTFPADQAPPEPGREPLLTLSAVTPGLFDALGVPLRAGRGFSDHDDEAAPLVVVLSEGAARRLFPDRDAVGRSIVIRQGGMEQRAEVVGLAGDVRSGADPTAMTAVVYQPWEQAPAPVAMGFVLRTTGDPAAFVEPARAALRTVDRLMPLYQPRPLADVLRQLDASGRFAAGLLAAFAVLGLTLVVTGIYGTLSHLVADRQREMGVRIALGASRGAVLGLVIRDGLRPAALGLAAGVMGAIAFGRLAASAVSGTPAFSAPLFVGVPLLLLAVVVAASLLPASRATRVDPVTVLK